MEPRIAIQWSRRMKTICLQLASQKQLLLQLCKLYLLEHQGKYNLLSYHCSVYVRSARIQFAIILLNFRAIHITHAHTHTHTCLVALNLDILTGAVWRIPIPRLLSTCFYNFIENFIFQTISIKEIGQPN